jgi:hypothetical protein
MIFSISDALLVLRPNAQWCVNGDSYAGIDWLDTEQTKPTEAEIQTEIARLQNEYDDKQYQRDRAAEYPSLQEQMDMQYWDSINGTTTWQNAINAIKTKYPKPD